MRRVPHLLLVVALAVVAWQSVVFGLTIAAVRNDASLAVRLAPGNALALAASAQDRLASDPAAAAIAAQRALHRDATNAAAAGVLSIARARAGQLAASRALLIYSQRMSRRDLPTQLWAIEEAVQRGDVAGALHQYDVTLRVAQSAPVLLFPVLTAASTDPIIRRPLARMLASGTPWGPSFLDYLAARAVDPVAAAELTGDVRTNGGTVAAGPVAVLVQRMIEIGAVEGAWALYAHIHPDAQRRGVRNGSFDKLPEFPTQFDWQLTDRDDAHAEILTDRKNGELQLQARAGAGGRVAHQRLMLAPGVYQLSLHARAAPDATLGDSSVEMACSPDGRRLAKVPLAATPGSVRIAIRLAVPTDCISQSLELVLDAGTTDASIDGSLDYLGIVPVRP